MTERPAANLIRDAKTLAIGPSAVRWNGEELEIDIAERDKRLGVPWRRPVRGRIRVVPEMLNPVGFALDPDEKHIWHCLAPRARIVVEMNKPDMSWSGSGYIDHNHGSEPLEEGFRSWHWSRAHLSDGAVVSYEGERGDGSRFASAIRFDQSGVPEHSDLPMIARLPRSKWQVARRTRADRGEADVVKTWEDTPFYARSTVSSRIYGEPVIAVQESLDLRRFASPVVQFMLPFRMPRREC